MRENYKNIPKSAFFSNDQPQQSNPSNSDFGPGEDEVEGRKFNELYSETTVDEVSGIEFRKIPTVFKTSFPVDRALVKTETGTPEKLAHLFTTPARIIGEDTSTDTLLIHAHGGFTASKEED